MTKPLPLPPLELLEKHFECDPELGELRWKNNVNSRARKGDIAGHQELNGYRTIRIYGKKYSYHRILWYLTTKRDPGELQIDHKNTIKSDNRFSNLRLVTNQQNQWNVAHRKTNKSGYIGVSRAGYRKWRCCISVNNKDKYIGTFTTKDEASAAYINAARELRGTYARWA